MRMGLVTSKKSLAPLLIVLSLSAPGCKSGWKMPGSGMFPWSRTPSAETLAANSTPKIETPSSKYTPSAISSVAAGNKSATSPTAPSTASAPGAGIPGSAVSYPMNGSTAAKSPYGAASSNGYQTGPYGMSGLTATVGGTTATAGSTTGYPSANSYAQSSVYGGTAGMQPGTANPYASAPTNASLANNGQNPYGAGAGAAGNYSMPNVTPPANTSMPSYNPGTGMPTGGPATTVGYPTGAPASAGYSTPNIPLPGGAAPQSYAPQTSAPTGGDAYRPGSTARGTTYNFGQTAAPATSTAAPTTGYPQATGFPQTAPSSMPGSAPAAGSYGNFQLPPNTATAPTQPMYR